jgi:hypothetical protein
MSQSQEQRIETFTKTLIERFGFSKKFAQKMATEAMVNLDRHVNLQQVMIKRVMENRKK